MINRLFKGSKSQSFFILGPRGSGKSTWLKSNYLALEHRNLYINLLLPKIEDHYRKDPEILINEISGKNYEWIIIDEVQKVPRLLDVIHYCIEEFNTKFILTGSSARKLKRGAANLLAGRVFIYYMYPFCFFELGKNFNFNFALNWGMLPKIYHLETDEERKDYLESYCLTYLKEEILLEQIIRKLDPFRLFLEVAAQMNGMVINYSKIAREVSVDTTTVQNYFSILEDTLIGFHLNAYHSSVRKRIIQAPKFYFFDIGIVRSLSNSLDLILEQRTTEYGRAFEHFVILEMWKLNNLLKKNFKMNYLLTKDGVEIDLILEGPGKKISCIEIKSSSEIKEEDISSFNKITLDLKSTENYCLSRDPVEKKFAHVKALFWKEGIERIFSL